MADRQVRVRAQSHPPVDRRRAARTCSGHDSHGRWVPSGDPRGHSPVAGAIFLSDLGRPTGWTRFVRRPGCTDQPIRGRTRASRAERHLEFSPVEPRAIIGHANESAIMCRRHRSSSISSTVPHRPMRARTKVQGHGPPLPPRTCRQLSMPLRTKSAASPVGNWRWGKAAPVAWGSLRRSRRKLRQSKREISQATRYQRRPSRTSRCGLTRRTAARLAGGVGELQPFGIPAGLGDRVRKPASTLGAPSSHCAGRSWRPMRRSGGAAWTASPARSW